MKLEDEQTLIDLGKMGKRQVRYQIAKIAFDQYDRVEIYKIRKKLLLVQQTNGFKGIILGYLNLRQEQISRKQQEDKDKEGRQAAKKLYEIELSRNQREEQKHKRQLISLEACVITAYVTVLGVLAMGIYYGFSTQSHVIGDKIQYSKITEAGYAGGIISSILFAIVFFFFFRHVYLFNTK